MRRLDVLAFVRGSANAAWICSRLSRSGERSCQQQSTFLGELLLCCATNHV